MVLLSPQGEVVLDEAHERVWSRFMHEPGDPLALGQFLQPELGRFVVRIRDEDLNRQAESWWAFDLASGAELFRERPKLALGLEGAVRSAPAVRAVPGTPLVLVHWYRFASEARPWSHGAVFQLLDAERRCVWRLDLPNDYEASHDEAAADRLRREIWREGAILATAPGRFELRHVAGNQRVSYAVARDSEEAWRVTELGRAPHEPPGATASPLGAPLRPELRAEVPLGGAPPAGEIRDVLAFDFDATGRLRFARREEHGYALMLLSEDGGLRRVTPVPAEVGPADRWLAWFPLRSPQWVAVSRDVEAPEGTPARAWRVDEESGEAVEIASFPGEDVARVLPLDGEHLLLLTTWHGKYTQSDALLCCDRDGRVLWQLGEDFEDPAALFAPEDVTVTRAGEVVVLDNVRDALQVYSGEGRYLRTIALASAWEAEPNYPSSVVADVEGGVLVHDFHGEVALWRMAPDGRVRSRLDACMADGTPREEYRRAVRVAPDGRLWTTDGHELVRLDEHGIADLVLGSPAPTTEIERPLTGAIDSTSGRILVLDDRTRALHAFDAEGRRVVLARPRPEDLDELRFPLRMGCDPGGGLFAAESVYAKRHVRFGADGSALGIEELAGRCATFLPDRQAYWCVRKDHPARFRRGGECELELPKTADGRWWRSIEDLAVSADGRLAVLELPGREGGIVPLPGEGLVALFDPEGRALAQHVLPEGIDPRLVALAGPWVLLSDHSDRAWLLDTRAGGLRSIELGEWADPEDSTRWGLGPSGAELWALQPKARRLLRFATPP